MKLKKRKKTSRLRGSRTAGTGFRQQNKAHNKGGGRGMAGSGKRGDQKKQMALTKAKKAGFDRYFGKKGFTSLHAKKNGIKTINLRDLKDNYFDGKNKLDFKEHKILGTGDGFKGEVIAKQASKTAIEKMTKAGGKIILPGAEKDKEVKKAEEKGKEKKSEKKSAKDEKKKK